MIRTMILARLLLLMGHHSSGLILRRCRLRRRILGLANRWPAAVLRWWSHILLVLMVLLLLVLLLILSLLVMLLLGMVIATHLTLTLLRMHLLLLLLLRHRRLFGQR